MTGRRGTFRLGSIRRWDLSGEEFRDFTLAMGGDHGSTRSFSRGCLRAWGGRSGTTALPLRGERSGAGWTRFVAGSFSVVSPDAGGRYRSHGFGPEQFSRHVLDHGPDADASRE